MLGYDPRQEDPMPESERSPFSRKLLLALTVAVGYALAARLGFVLRFPPATTSVLWPPNALLTAVLLLVPRERWWVVLAAAFPAHLLVELHAGLPTTLVLGLFVTNCSEALLGATLLCSWSDAPARFDSLRRVTALLAAAVVVAPLVTSFADAAVVHWLHDEAFWPVFRRRSLSNALSALTIIPSTVAIVSQGPRWLRESSRRRRLEAALLAAGLLAVGLLVFFVQQDEETLLPGAPYTSLTFLIPFLMAAAVRFGPGGAGLGLLATSLLAVRAAIVGWKPFSPLTPEDGVVALQVFVIVVGVPLLFLSALIEERRQTAVALRERLRFEELLSRLAAQFVHLPSQEVGRAFENGLQQLGQFFGVDRVALRRFDAGGGLRVVYAWSTPEAAGLPDQLERPAIPWVSERLLHHEAVVISDAAELPRQAEGERELLRRHGVRSFLVLPLVAGTQVLGCLGFVASSQARAWPKAVLERCRLIADLFASALARQGAEDAMRQAELEAQKSRQELAHFLRVSTIGELTTSLAHELNQPLTAILANAETATRLVRDSRAAGAEELREILADIASEDRRAGEFIKRLRQLLRKEEQPPRAVLDVNALVREIVELLASDALLRGVALRLDLHPGRLTVRGDRVQLQQVLLNILINAMEALAESGTAEPTVRVRTEDAGDTGVRISVRDTGPGLRLATPEGIFEPFYTTKAHGLGMGLSIARSIAAAHGGTIEASNNPTRGATFTLTLPAAPASGVLPSPAG